MTQSASHPVCRAAKRLPVGIWHPSVMQFYSGPLIHFLSGVDSYEWAGRTGRRHRQLILDFLAVVPFEGAAESTFP
jgi:hypothetical protein